MSLFFAITSLLIQLWIAQFQNGKTKLYTAEIGTFHLRGLAFQLSGKNPSFALQNTFHLRWFFTWDLPVAILQLRRLPVIF
jgi:hypothetical protein